MTTVTVGRSDRGERVRTYPQPFPHAGPRAGGAEVSCAGSYALSTRSDVGCFPPPAAANRLPIMPVGGARENRTSSLVRADRTPEQGPQCGERATGRPVRVTRPSTLRGGHRVRPASGIVRRSSARDRIGATGEATEARRDRGSVGRARWKLGGPFNVQAHGCTPTHRPGWGPS